ncbi:hypothetical protein [Marinobacterium lutimaris]|uniref:Uncharacterized protein n=1 Tax=Marinobacterium lutimaris TaxID=568106 RepID=A0A1H6BJL3_9GAMM|nr:hypothetical protein [Marinobacterium lutimaris]SEG60919.1 hypothetical protein SAMN05444390_102697 [Marinobacterium lutimaris]
MRIGSKTRTALTAGLITLSLAGCGGDFLKQDPTVDQFYTLDSEKLMLCRGLTRECRDLIPIASAQHLAPKIERAYGTDLKGPNYPLNLTRMMINPPDGSYKASPVDENGRYIRLPINEQTDLVWDVLQEAHDSIYED